MSNLYIYDALSGRLDFLAWQIQLARDSLQYLHDNQLDIPKEALRVDIKACTDALLGISNCLNMAATSDRVRKHLEKQKGE